MGKYFKRVKGIGKPEKEFKKTTTLPKKIENYLKWLEINGGLINKVELSEFYLKNGLPY